MHPERKTEQLRICLEEDVQFKELTTGLEQYRFIHRALPEINLMDVETSTILFGHQLSAPLIISPMTGGTATARVINRRLARGAQRLGVAMGVGSQRAAIVDPQLAATYQVRDIAPDILLFANLGAVQLNYGFGLTQARAAVDMIGADALTLHLNPLHEALQPHGDTNFAGLLPRIGEICAGLGVPVLVKEVGYGISAEVARQLQSVGVAGLDVAGAGGTAWGEVERCRTETRDQRIAAAFAHWGIPTATALRTARQVSPEWPVIASGGIRTGIEVAKCLALGANAAGLASPLLQAAAISEEAVVELLEEVVQELKITLFAVGARSIADLDHAMLERI